jgi:AraC family transcriptional regulator
MPAAYVEQNMDLCKTIADSPTRAANFSRRRSSNAEKSRDVPMNPVESIPPKTFASCPVTDTSGFVVRQREIAGFSLSERIYSSGLVLPPHCHAQAYLSFVLSGDYVEKYSHRTSVCTEGEMRFLPPGELHVNEFTTSARTLLVKIEPVILDRLGDHAMVLSTPGEVTGSACSWLANRMLREFAAEDDIAPMAIEGVLLEILAESARAIGEGGGSNAPGWLRRVREALEDSCLEAPSLSELATLAGVHPVHLSREFRKHYQSTIGEYIRKRRIEHASNLLANTATPLSEIALLCGFSDQSHFCAMFKAHTGLTPAKFRDFSART